MNITTVLGSRPVSVATTVLMAIVWTVFALSHIQGFRTTGDWSLLLFCGSETLVATLFLLRSEPAAVSHSPGDWLLAIASTFAPFFFAPGGEAILAGGRMLIVLGVIVQISGLLSLNRSFGLVAARREIKTSGLYRLIRHPLYASYFLTYAGYVLSNSGIGNVVTCLAAASLLVLRLVREERFLAEDATYRIYMRQVKYRLLPMVF